MAIKYLTLGVFLIFLFLGLKTLSDYGINWDAASHLFRGQAYLHYYLTGKKDYADLTDFDLVLKKRQYFQQTDTIFFNPDKPKNQIPRISIYQNPEKDLNYVMANYDYGHPHISDVLASFFNFIFFQKLGLLNDIDSYRVYGVILAAALVGLVFYWTASFYGKFAGLIAALSLSLYPLFWSESHFNNEKDIPETVFISFLIFFFFKGVTTSSWKLILLSGIFFGLALGTKFNALFSAAIILPWLLIYFISNKSKKDLKILLSILIAPIIGVLLFISSWPFFWTDPVGKISTIVKFYKTIGTNLNIDQRFIGPLNINTYPLQWILYTTPLVILLLSVIGILFLISTKFKDKHKLFLIFLLWLTIPILRVTWPGVNIYGGVRQIMEFIPAMAILSGIGGKYLADLIGNKQTIAASVLVVALFSPITIKLIQIHPNENVYFNPLIGGLKGAKEHDFPGWGVSFGAPYRQGVEWINKNAETGAKLTLGHEILSNLPRVFIRPDIIYESTRSGYLRQGEYVISLRFYGTDRRSYFDMYLDKMLYPVHQIKVDDVPVLKIWKNDDKYLKSEWKDEMSLYDVIFIRDKNRLTFDLGRPVKLSRLEFTYNQDDCPDLSWAYFVISKDGIDWERVPGVLPEEVKIKVLGMQPSNGRLIEPFVGQMARYIKIFLSPDDACVTKVDNVELYYFKDQ